MKHMLISLICLMLISSDCKRKNCHFHILFQNHSEKDVIFGLLFYYYDDNANKNCRIDGDTIKKNSVFEFHPFKGCIENNLVSGTTIEIYLIDVENYNTVGFYDCDSIGIKNKILKQFTLTIEDLKKNNFTITYP